MAFNTKGGYILTNIVTVHTSIKPKPHQKVHIIIQNKKYEVYVIAIPAFDVTIYTLQFQDGSIHHFHENKICEIMSTNHETTKNYWIQHLSPVTMFLTSIKRPQRGKLLFEANKWYFRHGYKETNDKIELPQFHENQQKYIDDGSLYKGHISIQQVVLNKSSKTLSTIVERYILTTVLQSHDVPTLLSHSKMLQNNKHIWDQAYAEECFGLKDLPVWSTLTEAEYQQKKTEFKTMLPTMAISTIKHDEFGKPKRAKYNIVAQGNLDLYNWTKPDCYVPVMSMSELRLMVSIAIQFKRIVKSGDFKQVFVQALLNPL